MLTSATTPSTSPAAVDAPTTARAMKSATITATTSNKTRTKYARMRGRNIAAVSAAGTSLTSGSSVKKSSASAVCQRRVEGWSGVAPPPRTRAALSDEGARVPTSSALHPCGCRKKAMQRGPAISASCRQRQCPSLPRKCRLKEASPPCISTQRQELEATGHVPRHEPAAAIASEFALEDSEGGVTYPSGNDVAAGTAWEQARKRAGTVHHAEQTLYDGLVTANDAESTILQAGSAPSAAEDGLARG